LLTFYFHKYQIIPSKVGRVAWNFATIWSTSRPKIYLWILYAKKKRFYVN